MGSDLATTVNKDESKEQINDEEVEEVKEATNDYNKNNFKYKLAPKLSADELSSFSKEFQDVYNYKCKYQVNDNGSSVTFYPAPHLTKNEYGSKLFEPQLLCQSFIIKNNVDKLEGINDWNEKVIIEDSTCSFISCCNKAWTKHYPLKISPSNILLLILQSIAIHVDKNSEKLRNKYVKHDDVKELTLYRDVADGFVFGSRNNDWSGVIKEFVQQIDKNTIDDTAKLMESDFSCSTIVDQISNKITIMDICKNYFRYHGFSGLECGFPQITLDGTKDDWIKLRLKCENLLKNKVDKKFGAKWSLSLLPVLDRFIAVYDGKIDCIFWNSMVKQTERQYFGSGGDYNPEQYWGWINTFFPYIQSGGGQFNENNYCFIPYKVNKNDTLKRFGNGGVECRKFPTGISYAPVKWTDLLEEPPKEYNLKFYSGFIGYKQCPKTFELSPAVSWFIGYSGDDQQKN